jgi:alkylated DNA repair dioxygenase AlkB
MQQLILTDKSFLNVYPYNEHRKLIKKCIKEVKDELIVKPPIKLYGKIVHQQRNIGFFSDESIAYYYSNQLAASKPLQPNLIELLKLINGQFGTKYNGILVNYYEDGTNYICFYPKGICTAMMKKTWMLVV